MIIAVATDMSEVWRVTLLPQLAVSSLSDPTGVVESAVANDHMRNDPTCGRRRSPDSAMSTRGYRKLAASVQMFEQNALRPA